jgi:hypothetical protein
MVDVRTYLNIIARKQIIQDVFVLKGHRLLENILVQGLDQKLITMQVYKNYSHKLN